MADSPEDTPVPPSGGRFDPSRYVRLPHEGGPPPVAPMRADVFQPKPAPPPDKPKLRGAAKAQRILERGTPSAARAALAVLSEVRPGEVCPTCKRGMPRADADRLRAAQLVLDKGGVATPKGGDAADLGPPIVLPPGTRVALVAEVPDEEGQSSPRPGGTVLRLTRADRYAGGETADPVGDVEDTGGPL